MNYKPKSYVFCVEMVKSINYFNKNGDKPSIGTLIKWNVVVFDKNNLKDDNWFFCNEDKDVLLNANKQLEDLKIFDDDIFILE